MSDFVDSLLADGEQVVMRARQHWWALIRFALQPILILIAAVVCFGIGTLIDGDFFLGRAVDWLLGLVTLGLFLAAIVWLPIMVVRWISRRYALTNRRVIYADGVLRKQTVDASLDKITDVGFGQGVLGRWLGFGDLAVMTSAGQPMTFRAMIEAAEFKKAILNAQEALIRARAGDAAEAVRQAVGGSPAATVLAGQDPTETLTKLAALRDSGAIAEADFDAKKDELLKRV
jgi:uncharacterized membrane protein YdbT with pleckstrin-like domain